MPWNYVLHTHYLIIVQRKDIIVEYSFLDKLLVHSMRSGCIPFHPVYVTVYNIYSSSVLHWRSPSKEMASWIRARQEKKSELVE